MTYRDLNSYLKETFGTKVYKIALSMPFTCPNRDGKVGTGGCIFCSGQGSGDFAASSASSLEEQLREGKARVKNKVGEDARYIAYFQSFTSTYGPIEMQREYFSAALAVPDVVALSVATRPDCLPDEVLDLLEDLSSIKPVWVELGFQTAREDTANYIRRGYDNSSFVSAVEKLKKRGLLVVVHLILGLPFEDHEDEIQSVRFVTNLGIDGLKLQLLHVLRGTALAETDYQALSFEEYIYRVTDLLRYIPQNVVIHRLTGDGAKRDLIAPLWSADKKRVLNAITKRILEEKIIQGEEISNNC